MCNIILAALVFALAASASALPECPPEGSTMFYLLPHETDCSKFYICSHGNPVLQTCPEGTHFNPIFMVCQNPVFAGCDSSAPDSPLACTWPDSIVHRPHPDSCSKYYVCEFGVAQIFNCPEGLEFSAELQECVWPHESNCNISQHSPEDADSQNGGQDGGCTSGALSKHEECGKYYVCDHGANVALDCASGLQWSSKLEQCVWPPESDCGLQDGAQPDAAQNGVEQNGEQDGGQECEEGALSASEDCSKYSICNHGVLVSLDCPAGLHWNSKLSFCDWPVSAGCQQ